MLSVNSARHLQRRSQFKGTAPVLVPLIKPGATNPQSHFVQRICQVKAGLSHNVVVLHSPPPQRRPANLALRLDTVCLALGGAFPTCLTPLRSRQRPANPSIVRVLYRALGWVWLGARAAAVGRGGGGRRSSA